MAESHAKLVCFDLDGTVVLRPNSLQYLLALNNAPREVLADIDAREASGETDWIAADHERAIFIAGLPVAAIEEEIDAQLVTVGNLAPVLASLRALGILAVLITSGPVEVAQAVAKRFPFDDCFGSEFEKSTGGQPTYTGRITKHLGSAGKLDTLKELCRSEAISLRDCVAVGDGVSDADLFRAAGTPIGINCAPEVVGMVAHEIRGQDLSLLLQLIL
jgi:phosphoserine phosphatase